MRTCAVGVLVIGGCLLAAPVDAREGGLDPAFGDVVARVRFFRPWDGLSLVEIEDGSLVIRGGEVIG